MDNVASGADTEATCTLQIQQVRECLSHGGFSTKYVARSHHPPPEGASSDGRTLTVLGVGWTPEDDFLSPAIQPMNLESKVRGAKPAPTRDVTTPEGLRAAGNDGLLTKSRILSRVAEFYDPAGWWEPIKLQMKLLFRDLVPLDWGDSIPHEAIDGWVTVRNCSAHCSVVPGAALR